MIELNRTVSWVSSPGIVLGCEVVKDIGFNLAVNPGVLFSVNGLRGEIPATVKNSLTVPLAVDYDRLDYVLALLENGGILFRYIRGVESQGRLIERCFGYRDGIILAKVLVKFPTISLTDSVFIYNALPAMGEPFTMGVSPLESPDGVKKSFTFPFLVPSTYSLNLSVDSLHQYEGIDFEVSGFTAQSTGGGTTNVTFIGEAPGPKAVIVADMYRGKVRL